MATLQIPMSGMAFNYSREIPPISQCHQIWDIRTARFTPCFVPYVATIPAILAALVLLTYSLSIFGAYRPKWTKPFIREPKETPDDLDTARQESTLTATFALLAVASIGLTLQIVTVVFPERQVTAIYPAFAWGVACAVVLVERPRTAPISLFFVFLGLLFTQVVMLSHTRETITTKDIPLYLALIMAFVGILMVLSMPLRDPTTASKDISPVFTAPTSKLRTPEDNLTPWQYMSVTWMTPLIQKGMSKHMEDHDVWDLGYEFKHERLHNTFRELPGSVTRRIFFANGMDLVRSAGLSFARLCATLLMPVMLQRILASMKDPNSPKSATITYALVVFFLRVTSAQLNVFNLWYQRRAYERSRGEMITMLYEKTLKRKNLGIEQDKEDKTHNGGTNGVNGVENGGSNGVHEDDKKSKKSLLKRILSLIWSKISRKSKKEAEKKKEPAQMGKILNLMRNDVYEVAQRFWDFSDILINPAGAILSILLIWRMLGWACLLGLLAIGVTQLINIVVARYLVYFEKKRRLATDEKLQKTSQFIESIRHLRWYGWQDAWLKGILEARQKELHLRIYQILCTTTLAFLLRFGSGLFPAVAFYAFTTLAGKPLPVEIIFPAFDLFNLLETYLRMIPDLITTMLNAYVAIGRIEEFMNEPDKEEADLVPEGSAELKLASASFAWPGVDKNVLEDLTLTFPTGLTVIYGEVAAGKTALLQALLGEIDKTAGDFIQPDQVIGYCAQTPWLQSMSIRDNILFSYPYDEVRYKQVLEACALLPDMAELKHGDLSNIGENGIGLSGGQKARVALARAVYSSAKILLLDDPLSALDHQTAEFIVRKLLRGPLLETRTTILVTHRTELCHGLAKQWIQVDHGRISFDEPTRIEDARGLQRVQTNESITEEEAKKREDEEAAAVPDKFIEDEHRARGGVKWEVYWRYIRVGAYWWLAVIIVMAIFRVFDVGQGWLVKAWGESYDYGQPKGVFDFLPPVTEDVLPWIWTFFGFVTVTALLFWGTNLIMFGVGYHTSKVIFEKTLRRVAHATFRYYDVTPVGRLMNRLTSDMNTIDGNLAGAFTVFAWQAVGWVTAIVIILSATPAFLAFGLILACGFVYVFLRFLPTSQSLRRLEMVSLSPLMSNFGALVEGLTTVRAFNAQSRFQARVIEVVDNFQKNDHFYWSLQAWLTLRFSVMSAGPPIVMTLIAIYTNISTGLTAFVLIAATKFVIHTEWMCRIYGNLEMDFTSVERVIELLDVEMESPGVVDPPAHWPTYSGDIEFEDVTIRYAEHMEPALQNITLKIPAGSNTAVIGRTGSGKSTLALSLLATIAAESGTIFIDGIDISTVSKQALRSRVTFLAQEPVLFPGSMRKNLDPLEEYSDAACESVLSKIAGRHNWTLSTNIEAGGKGLSQGQRQLVGLARAMLRRSPVLIMDEATASIDFETAQSIQSVLRDEMKQSTVITIAHRLEAVKNADYCIVLGKGKVLKAGKAADILKDGGEFSEMLA